MDVFFETRCTYAISVVYYIGGFGEFGDSHNTAVEKPQFQVWAKLDSVLGSDQLNFIRMKIWPETCTVLQTRAEEQRTYCLPFFFS